MISIPSATTVSSTSKGEQLSKWKRKLTPDQIDRTLDVVHDVGVTGYTNDLHPESPMTFQ